MTVLLDEKVDVGAHTVHKVQFDGRNYTSGIYCYRLTENSESFFVKGEIGE